MSTRIGSMGREDDGRYLGWFAESREDRSQKPGRTLRSLIEEKLVRVLHDKDSPEQPFLLRDASVSGQGLQSEQSWDEIRAAVYEGRGG
jgi:hypothetical protein